MSFLLSPRRKIVIVTLCYAVRRRHEKKYEGQRKARTQQVMATSPRRTKNSRQTHQLSSAQAKLAKYSQCEIITQQKTQSARTSFYFPHHFRKARILMPRVFPSLCVSCAINCHVRWTCPPANLASNTKQASHSAVEKSLRQLYTFIPKQLETSMRE